MGSINLGIGDLFPVTVTDFCFLDLVFSGVGLLRKLCPVATSEHHISRCQSSGRMWSRTVVMEKLINDFWFERRFSSPIWIVFLVGS